MSTRKICIVTGTRADYGLLRWLMHEVDADPSLELQIAATGMHLAPEFGETGKAIEADGFTIDERVEMLVSSDTAVGTVTSMGLGMIGFATAIDRLDPDVVVVIGDRFEIWVAAQAAFVAGRRIAHIHGGETTEGAFDEGIRHSLTKLAHVHFVAAEPYRKRVIQLGEHPDRVFTVGAPGLDHLSRTERLSREDLAALIGLDLREPTFAVTLHPATLGGNAEASARALTEALDAFPQASVVITAANADPAGRIINEHLSAYARSRATAEMVISLGQQRYTSLLEHADVVIGNSSSGLLEAPPFETPTVNIGGRQQGRLRAASVLDVAPESTEIVQAIRKALTLAFRSSIQGQHLPYGRGGASAAIHAHLRDLDLEAIDRAKPFYDIDFELTEEVPLHR
jgi:UDP-hydrolysing UDP-N-acetyl-D-glucosamine 2-epimerase